MAKKSHRKHLVITLDPLSQTLQDSYLHMYHNPTFKGEVFFSSRMSTILEDLYVRAGIPNSMHIAVHPARHAALRPAS